MRVTLQTMCSFGPLETCLLIGDSITQTCAAGSFYQRIAEYYQRQLDVVNRGLGGYNTEWMIPVLQDILPQTRDTTRQPRLVRIRLGTNDAALPPATTHTPLDQYRSNLHSIISLLQDPKSLYYSPNTTIILLTPGPVLAEVWRKGVADWAILSGLMTPEEMVAERDHDPKVMQTYAKACLQVGKEAGLDVVDVHSGIIADAGGDTLDVLLPYFTDGLHMTKKGYAVVFKLFKELIESKYPRFNPSNMPKGIPDFALLGQEPVTKTIADGKIGYQSYWRTGPRGR